MGVLPACMLMACGGHKRVLGPLKLESQTTVSHCVVLRTQVPCKTTLVLHTEPSLTPWWQLSVLGNYSCLFEDSCNMERRFGLVLILVLKNQNNNKIKNKNLILHVCVRVLACANQNNSEELGLWLWNRS